MNPSSFTCFCQWKVKASFNPSPSGLRLLFINYKRKVKNNDIRSTLNMHFYTVFQKLVPIEWSGIGNKFRGH